MAYRAAPQASPDPNRYEDEQYAMRFQPQSQVRPSPSLPSMPREHDFNRRPLSDNNDFEKPGPDQDNDFDEIYSQYTTPVLAQNEFTGLNGPSNPRAGNQRNQRGNPRGGRMGVGAGGGRDRGYPSREAGGMSKKKKRNIIAGVVTAIVVICAVAIPVGIVVSNNNAKNASSSSSGRAGSNGTKTRTSSSAPTPTSTQPTVAVSGADGSEVISDLGAKFTYTNKFGGSWAFDPAHPFDGSAGRGGQSQDYVPRIGEEWVWGRDRIHGVNLGGWLVTAFIVPGLYEQYQNTTIKAIDEYTLSQAMGDDLAEKMEEHYRTFITEEDFALIAGAGLNFVRIPLGFWAVETKTDEPYLQGVSWKYFLKAIAWGRKYGIRIKLDLHALPGSQNGWNHSGKSGSVNWMSGVMGIANAQRALEVLRSFTQFISQPQYTDVVPLLGIVNEVQAELVVGQEVLAAFYYQAYQTIRGVTGVGAGKGPYIVIHEGFAGIASWRTFLAGADRLVLDQHPYNAFGPPNTNPWDVQSKSICEYLPGTTDVQSTFGVIVGGEWSNAINDCGKWLNGVGSTQQYLTVGSCDKWNNWQAWDDETKAGVKQYAMSNMDALQNWFFWTWKIGVSTEFGYATSPFWHYKAGLENGWMPVDPREAYGTCNTLGMPGSAFNGTYPATATGADPTATISADQVASHNVFPPTALGPPVGTGTPKTSMFSASQISLFPTLTQTGSPVTLTASAQASGIDIGNGWANPSDSVGAYVTVAGCSYPDEYDATALSLVPTAVCTGNGQRKREGFYPRQTMAAK